MSHGAASILSLSELQHEVAHWRAHNSGNVVLANGAFDLLHVGHLRYLAAAKLQGALLVVAVNSDSSVRAAKGATRPIIPAHERAELIASLYCVDYVTIFDHDTVRPIIRALRPDVHAKGTDYTVATVPEAELTEALGGRVAIVGDLKNHATSHLVRTLRAEAKGLPSCKT